MTLNIPLAHAFKKATQELLTISEVESGLKCGCECPACGSVLVAVKGNKKAHHFRHHNTDECEYAGETVLHFMAKEIVKEYGCYLPSIIDHASYLQLREFFDFLKLEDITHDILGRHIFFDNVILEKSLGSIIPDIIGVKDGTYFLIEIAVTHFVDKDKAKKINDMDIEFCLEIDLSDLKTIPINDLVLRNHITEAKTQKSQWIKKPKWSDYKSSYRPDLHIEDKNYDRFYFDFDDYDNKIRLSPDAVTETKKGGFKIESWSDIYYVDALVFPKGNYWKVRYNDYWGKKNFRTADEALAELKKYVNKQALIHLKLYREKSKAEENAAKSNAFNECVNFLRNLGFNGI